MNWEALAAIGELVGAAAVVATLVYLSVQIRGANKQAEIEAHRHSWDGLNQFCDKLSEPSTAAIVLRGRESLAELTDAEGIVFEHLHLRLLNTLESWHLQIDRTSARGPYRDSQMANISSIAEGYLGYSGTRDLWKTLRHYYPPIRPLVDKALSGADADTA